MCIGAHVCPCGVLRLRLGAFLDHSLPYTLRQGLLLDPRALHSARLASLLWVSYLYFSGAGIKNSGLPGFLLRLPCTAPRGSAGKSIEGQEPSELLRKSPAHGRRGLYIWSCRLPAWVDHSGSSREGRACGGGPEAQQLLVIPGGQCCHRLGQAAKAKKLI